MCTMALVMTCCQILLIFGAFWFSELGLGKSSLSVSHKLFHFSLLSFLTMKRDTVDFIELLFPWLNGMFPFAV